MVFIKLRLLDNCDIIDVMDFVVSVFKVKNYVWF